MKYFELVQTVATYKPLPGLRETRKKCKISASELARRIGVTPTYICEIERGIKSCSERVAKAIEKELSDNA